MRSGSNFLKRMSETSTFFNLSNLCCFVFFLECKNSLPEIPSAIFWFKPKQAEATDYKLCRGVEVFDDFMDEHEQKAKEDRRRQRKEYVEKVKDTEATAMRQH